jgi:hypothetical protein
MRVLTFAAVLLESGDLQLEPGFVMDGEPSREGELTVEALSRGRTLASTQVPFETPCGYAPDRPAERPPRTAVGLVEFPERADGLRVIHEGKALLERTAPRVAGEPEVTWPDALEGDSVSLTWRSPAEDARASLGYSNDGGATWQPLALPTREETVVFDASTLPGGDRCLLELAVTDGFETTRVQSGEYEVKPKGWVLWILAPAAGASLRPDAPVLLAAQGYQVEERRASFDGIAWTSSLDGGLGEGAQVMAALSAGDHTIAATMLDAAAKAVELARSSKGAA